MAWYQALPYLLLVASFGAVFFRPNAYAATFGLLMLALVAGYATGLVNITAIAITLASVGLLWWLRQPQPRWLRASSWLTLTLLSLAYALHWLPGFANLLLLSGVQVSPNAVPFTLYANFDKGIAALLLLVALQPYWAPQRVATAPWRAWLRGWWPALPMTIFACQALGLWFGLLDWHPKWPSYSWLFLAVNLCLTCAAEELFFRGLLQTPLQWLCQRRQWPQWFAVLPVAGLFGAVHLAGGTSYALIVTLAGVGYGVMYLRSGRIEVAIVGHFMVNMVHFFLFSYPMLTPAFR